MKFYLCQNQIKMELLRKKQRITSSGSLEMRWLEDKAWSRLETKTGASSSSSSFIPLGKHDGTISNPPPLTWPPPACLLPLPWARFEVICCCSLPSRSRHTPLIHFTLLPPLSFPEFFAHRAHVLPDGLHGETAEMLRGEKVANSCSAVSCFHYLNSQGEGPAPTALLLHPPPLTRSVTHAVRPLSTVSHLDLGRVCSTRPSRD